MLAHHEQIACYFDAAAIAEVRELRCTTCAVVVDKFQYRFGQTPEAEIQRQIRQARARHSTPPTEPNYEI